MSTSILNLIGDSTFNDNYYVHWSVFRSFSDTVSAAVAAAAAAAGVTISDIMQAVDWSTKSLLFSTFYYQPSNDVCYGRTILSSSASGDI